MKRVESAVRGRAGARRQPVRRGGIAASLGAMMFAASFGAVGSEDRAGVDAILECMRSNVPEAVRVRDFRLEAFQPGGRSRVTEGRLYMQREDGYSRANVRLLAPADLAGTSYLWREFDGGDDTFVHLPALNRTRRIIGNVAGDALLDTDFSLRDLQQVQRAFAGGGTELLGSDEHEGRPVWRLRLTPGDDEDTPYVAVESRVDKAACVTLRAEFFDADGLAKQYYSPADALVNSGAGDPDAGVAYWHSERSTMRNLRSGTHTDLYMSGVSTADRHPSRLFTRQNFHLGN